MALLSNKDRSEYLWKHAENEWCLLEIVCHLYDEEREDFRQRVRQTLENPGSPPPPIDPENWVHQRKYIEKDYQEMLDSFLLERSKSIEWLKGLQNPQWDNNYRHPELGALSAKYFLTNWLAHDILHFRQIITLQYQYLQQSTEVDLIYSGSW
jgi:hypothetical protein